MLKQPFSIVTTTVGTRDQAIMMADAIVEARLAACAQFWPIRSTYRWRGKIEHSSEQLLCCKTLTARVPALQRFIRDHHEYEVPEIVSTPVTGGSPAYLAWIKQETSRPRLTFPAPATRKRPSRKGRN